MKNMNFIIAMILFSVSLQAQNSQVRSKGISIMGGITGKGYYGELFYNQYLTSKFQIEVSGRAELAQINEYAINSYSINPAINYTIFRPVKWVSLNIKAGFSAYVNERTNSTSNDVLLLNRNTLILDYGAFAGIETEVYLSSRCIWLTNIRQNYNINSSPGNLIFYAGTGVRILFMKKKTE
jgi:hypothetical protein